MQASDTLFRTYHFPTNTVISAGYLMFLLPNYCNDKLTSLMTSTHLNLSSAQLFNRFFTACWPQGQYVFLFTRPNSGSVSLQKEGKEKETVGETGQNQQAELRRGQVREANTPSQQVPVIMALGKHLRFGPVGGYSMFSSPLTDHWPSCSVPKKVADWFSPSEYDKDSATALTLVGLI